MVKNQDEPRPSVSVGGPMTLIAQRQLNKKEVAKHNKEDDCWVIIDGRVFDVTAYLQEHPGKSCSIIIFIVTGAAAPILVYAGKDASRDFHDIHSKDALDMK